MAFLSKRFFLSISTASILLSLSTTSYANDEAIAAQAKPQSDVFIPKVIVPSGPPPKQVTVANPEVIKPTDVSIETSLASPIEGIEHNDIASRIIDSESATEKAPPLPTAKPKKQKKSLFYIPSKPKPLSFLKNAILSPKASASDKDVQNTIARYKKIFDHQNRSQFKKADAEIAKLKNKSLTGHILLHRYMHPTGYQASFEELSGWLQRYSDHPTASRVYKLAKRRAPGEHHYTLPTPRQNNYIIGSAATNAGDLTFTPAPAKRSNAQDELYRSLKKTVSKHISNGFPSGAKKAIETSSVKKFISQEETDMLFSKVALSYLVEGKSDDAFSLASLISERHGSEIPLSGWISGIATWKQKRYALSAQYFQKTATSEYSNAWTASAASYWAARSYARLRNKDKTLYWLKEAALYPRTFYGMIANKTLNVENDFRWSAPEFTQSDRALIFSHPRGERAFFLAHAGLENLATMELEAIDTEQYPALKDAILAMASHQKLSRFLFKFGNSFKHEDGRYYDSALYPQIASWDNYKPHTIDKALIHAIVRQESRFKTDAQSPNGAIGLMQVMPSTAAYIMDDKNLLARDRWKLASPIKNLQVGEKYVSSLLNNPEIDNNLFHLLIAYNAGPGTLQRWKSKVDAGSDPLLMIELLPSAETRAFIERVMTNLWIYRDQFNQESPSLEAIINDVAPPYRSLDNNN